MSSTSDMENTVDSAPLTALEEHRFPCTTCGSDMRFDPQGHQLSCDHCGAREPLETANAPAPRELDYHDALRSALPEQDMEETRVSQCPNCGAQVEFDTHLHAAECPFCATPVVTDTGEHRQIKPRGLLPFSLPESQAHAAMSDWLGSLWFAPGGLKAYARKGRKMSGVYVPYWTYDAQTQSNYTGQRGKDYYVSKTVTRNGKRQTVRERRTKWRNVSGRVARFFDDVLVLGSTSLPPKYTEGLEPWDLGAIEPYVPDYLAGFRAESYTISVEDGFEQARDKMDRIILREVKFDIGGDRQRVQHVQTQVADVTFKHILLPVWMAAYKYRGKTYRFVVNGRTGRVQGERPWSSWKIAFAILIGGILAGCIGYIIAQNQ